MKLDEMVATARDALTVRRVYGEPFTQDGTTVIPAARLAGGAGGGGGHDPRGQEGEGGGFGVQARPVGAYVIKDGIVQWTPAIDANRVLALISAVLIVIALRGRRRRMRKR